MLVLGDVLAVLAIVVIGSIAVWGMILANSLLFITRINRAESILVHSPWKAFGIGVLITFIVGLIAISLLSTPFPITKLLGHLSYLSLIAIAPLGLGALASLLSKRIEQFHRGVPAYIALARGASLVVLAAIVPLVGWFVFLPVMLLLSIGVAFLAFFGRRSVNSVSFEVA